MLFCICALILTVYLYVVTGLVATAHPAWRRNLKPWTFWKFVFLMSICSMIEIGVSILLLPVTVAQTLWSNLAKVMH